MRLLDHAAVARVPGLDAVVEARSDAGPEPAQPAFVARDAPLAVDLEDASELAVGRRVERVRRRTDRKRRAEGLVPARVLRHVELGLAQPALERRKQVRQRLRVVPDVGAAPVAAAPVVVAAFPGPEPPVGLAQHGRRLEDREVGRHRLDHLGRQRAVVEALAEAGRPLTQAVVLGAPVVGDLLDRLEALGVPRPIRRLRRAGRGLGILPRPQMARADVPREPERDALALAGGERERDEQAGRPGRGCLPPAACRS